LEVGIWRIKAEAGKYGFRPFLCHGINGKKSRGTVEMAETCARLSPSLVNSQRARFITPVFVLTGVFS
jgi:hypothetical protein